MLTYSLLASSAAGFSTRATHPTCSHSLSPKTVLEESKGFGKESASPGKDNSGKTYGDIATIKDVIDTEGAMSEFFSSNEEWHPLFRSFAESTSVPAMEFLVSHKEDEFDFDNAQAPWKRLGGIPTSDSDREILAGVLDTMQAGLIDIPVNEAVKEDGNDLHFLEEGRRMLAISRFHVLQGVTEGSGVEGYDTLFATCWSEMMELRVKNEDGSGSLIVLPDYDLTDLRRFTDVNLLRPLEWLGVQADYEITSLEFGKPAIRLLHKLQEMPNEPWNDPEEDGGALFE